MNEARLDDETEAARDRGWRGAATVALGIAGLALLLASENLGAGSIYNVTQHYPGIDKLAHVGQYACVFLVVWWLLGRDVPSAARRGAVAAGVTLLLGTSDEVLQRFVADRTFDLVDLAANVVGVLLGVGLAPVVPSRRLARRLIAAAVVAAIGVTAYSYFGLRHVHRHLAPGSWTANEPRRMFGDNDGDAQPRPPVRDQPSGRIAGRPLSRPDLR